MIVCIAEKPSVARDIARILGANSSHDGYMEGNGYQVTWTFGHLCTLKEPGDYTQAWKPWALTQLPMVPQRFGIKLEKLMQAADGIVNCGDAGQEGELIQRWVMQKAQATCPVKRLWISSMTDEAIREGFANLKDQTDYQPLYLAGLSRAIGDWLLGMNATRLYTLKYGQNRQVLSIGRVQTPTLALIVNRQKEIENFKPEPYWVLATVYRDTIFTATKGKFTSKEEGEKAFATIEGKPFTVTKVEKKEHQGQVHLEGGRRESFRHHRGQTLHSDKGGEERVQPQVRLFCRDDAQPDPSPLREEIHHLSPCGYAIPERRYISQMSSDTQRVIPDEICRRSTLCGVHQAHRRQGPEEIEACVRHLQGDRPPCHHPYRRGAPESERCRAESIRPHRPQVHRCLPARL